MNAVKFNLRGSGACFKVPYENAVNITYNHIHKIALLGILGAMIGYDGLGEMYFSDSQKYPEFYDRLRKLKISIRPEENQFKCRIKVYTDTTGASSHDTVKCSKGGKETISETLIIKEQFLCNPSWDIYLLDDESIKRDIYDKIKDYIINKKTIYNLYLGKNTYSANIEDGREIKLKKPESISYIDSLFIADDFILSEKNIKSRRKAPFLMKQMMPFKYDEGSCRYIEKEMALTTIGIEKCLSKNVYSDGEYNLQFI